MQVRRKKILRDADMKKLVIIFFIIFTLIGIMHAQSYAYEKIGFFDIREVMQKSEVGKKSNQEFQKILEGKKVMLNNVEKDLKERKNYLDKNRSLSPSAGFKEFESDYEKRLNEYRDLVNNTNKELQQKDREFASKLVPQILRVIQRIKAEEKYTYILDKGLYLSFDGKPWPDGVSYSQDKDITAKIVAELNLLTGI
jgi:Skp family chaperone for outer membrane proteins